MAGFQSVLNPEEVLRLRESVSKTDALRNEVALDPFGNIYAYSGATIEKIGGTTEPMMVYYNVTGARRTRQTFAAPGRYVIVEHYDSDGQLVQPMPGRSHFTVHHLARRWVGDVPEIVFLDQHSRHLVLTPVQNSVLHITDRQPPA